MDKKVEEAWEALVSSIERASPLLLDMSNFALDLLAAMRIGRRRRLRLFLLGWRRRSSMILDAAGCPGWLIKRRCPTLNNWGTILHKLTGKEEV